jgi:hypothetical protein
LEVLLNKIRHEIPALTVDNFSVGCIAFSDDLTVFLRTAKDLRRLLALIRSFAPISGLHINVEKTEAMELGVFAFDCGIQVKTEMTITSLVFCKNPDKMSDSNWNTVYTRVKEKLDGWSDLVRLGQAQTLWTLALMPGQTA